MIIHLRRTVELKASADMTVGSFHHQLSRRYKAPGVRSLAIVGMLDGCQIRFISQRNIAGFPVLHYRSETLHKVSRHDMTQVYHWLRRLARLIWLSHVTATWSPQILNSATHSTTQE